MGSRRRAGEELGIPVMSTLLHRYNKVGFRVAIKALMCRVLYRLGSGVKL